MKVQNTQIMSFGHRSAHLVDEKNFLEQCKKKGLTFSQPRNRQNGRGHALFDPEQRNKHIANIRFKPKP